MRSFGDLALLLECRSTAEVRAAYAEALRRREAHELTCTDLVPAARTLLLDGLEDPEQVLGALGDWPGQPPDDERGELVELPITYDGPDLESVAEHCSLEIDELVRRHRETELAYVVGSASNRIGLRLEGERIRWRDKDELRSEGMVLGAVQVAERAAVGVPQRPPDDWWLPGDRCRGSRRPARVRPAAAG